MGVREATGKNDGIPSERYVRGEKLPWCAAFALWCNAQSDELPCARTNAEWYEMRSVATFEAEMKKRGWWLPPSTTPEAGMLIFFSSRGGSDPAAAGRHMGLVELVSGFLVQTIEGNVGNRVSRVVHNLANLPTKSRISGYARVPLKPEVDGKVPPK